jgi:anthranilate phosphoribosyltransferase
VPTPALFEAIKRLGSGLPLAQDQAHDAVVAIIDGQAEPAEIAAFLTALHCRVLGIDVATLTGATEAVLKRMTEFEVAPELRPILDTCGTGGDGVNSVNISTASAIVVAACGVRVAKHGNRSASGNSGSSEVLFELGVKYDAEPAVLARCLEEVGITFLFAPNFHGALKHASPVRKLLPFRTIFNLIGPLVNPAQPDAQVIGVPDREKAELVRNFLRDRTFKTLSPNLAKELHDQEMKYPGRRPLLYRAYVVTAQSGLDEVTLSGTTHAFSTTSQGEEVAWEPSDFGLPPVGDSALTVTGPKDSADKIRAMLAGEHGPIRDVVLANAAAALKLVEKVDSLAEGVSLAAEAIDRGDAAYLLERWVAVSHS